LPPKLVRESLAQAAEHGLAPFELWSGIRLYNVNQGWIVMDTVGNWQLDMRDHEAAFRGQSFQPPDVDRFLRNVSLYILENGEVIKDKDTTDGPGGVRWRARICEESLLKPPRRVYRWFPANEPVVPAFLRPKP